MRVLAYELRLSIRRLWRRRSQSGLMLATFAISITLSLLSWSLFHTIFLKNPEFDPRGSLYRIGQTGAMVQDRIVQSPLEDVAAWKEQQTVFTDFTPVILYLSTFVATNGGVERLLSAAVSTEAFRMVGAVPLMGRLFTVEEDKPGCAPVVILSETTWRSRFDGDPQIIGRIIMVDSVPATVVGVMPKAFRFPNEQEMWQPLGFHPYGKGPNAPVMDVLARLQPGQTPERAVEDLKLITDRRGNETWSARYQLHPVVQPFRENYLFPEMYRSAVILFALALVFVLVGCANAANLVIIDFLGRAPEIASSLALGIPKIAVIRGLVMQLSLIAGLAAVIGSGILLVAAPPIHAAMAAIVTPYWLFFSPEWHHFAMAALLAFVSVAVALIAPLSYLLVFSPEKIIQNGAGASRGSGRAVWRRGLMIAQIALLTVLAVSAGLLLRSSRNVGEKYWGYDASKIFTSKTAVKDVDFPTPAARLAVHLKVLDEIEQIPGVAAAALMTVPHGYSNPPEMFYSTTVEGLADGRSEGGAVWSLVTPNIFGIFNTPFLEGKTFDRDPKLPPPPAPNAPTTAIPIVINASLAQKLWPREAALGRELYIRWKDPKMTPIKTTIYGVVRDFQAAGPKAKVNDFVYARIGGGMAPASFLYVRGEQSVPTVEAVRGAVARVDPRLIIYFPGTVRLAMDRELSSVRLTTTLTLGYALSAVLLCAVGVYSLTVSQILQRHREFGIRLALGIESDRLWRQFSRSHLITASLGIALGLAAAVGVARLLQSLLFGVDRHDPTTFVVASAIILLVSALACVPSYFRLRRINPADCLRSL